MGKRRTMQPRPHINPAAVQKPCGLLRCLRAQRKQYRAKVLLLRQKHPRSRNFEQSRLQPLPERRMMLRDFPLFIMRKKAKPRAQPRRCGDIHCSRLKALRQILRHCLLFGKHPCPAAEKRARKRRPFPNQQKAAALRPIQPLVSRAAQIINSDFHRERQNAGTLRSICKQKHAPLFGKRRNFLKRLARGA